MSDLKDAAAIGVDVALAGVTMRIAELQELHDLELQMTARHAAGETLSPEEIQAQFDKTDAAIRALVEQITASRVK